MKLTKDDERARKICSLALEFMNAHTPLSSSTIAREFYPSLKPDSFRKAFSRDRTLLANCGIALVEQPQGHGDSLWSVDETHSFAQGAELGALEAMSLDVACQPLLHEEGFAFAHELRFALAKLNRAFAEYAGTSTGEMPAENRILTCLRSCLLASHAAQVSYTDVQGRTSTYLLAPYGFFSLRGAMYLVAARLDSEREADKNNIRTYKVERFSEAQELTKTSFVIPTDFDVNDWRHLPFQMGPTLTEATFCVEANEADALKRACFGRGTFEKCEGKTLWTVEINSYKDAASWAIAHGIRPLRPEALVSVWHAQLEEVVNHAS